MGTAFTIAWKAENSRTGAHPRVRQPGRLAGESACPTGFCIFLRFSVRPGTKCGAGAFACQPIRLPNVLPQKTPPLASRYGRGHLPVCHLAFVWVRPQGSTTQRLAGESACPTGTSAGRAFLALDREADKAAFGPVWLRDPGVANAVADALLYGESGRHFYQLRAWVIMPNHVHALLRPQTSLPVITRWLKGSTARQANLILCRTGKAFWQDESFDHRVRDEVELGRLVRYIEHNPVSAGLVADPRDWPWSSARLAGESACPTFSARTNGKSQKNTEAVGANPRRRL